MSTVVDYSFDNTAPGARDTGVAAPDNTAPGGVTLAGLTPDETAPEGKTVDFTPDNTAAAGVSLAALTPDNAAPDGVTLPDFTPDNTAPAGVSLAALAPSNTEPEGKALPSFAPDETAPSGVALVGLTPDETAPVGVALVGLTPDNTAPDASATGISAPNNDPARARHTTPATAKPYDPTVNTPTLSIDGALVVDQLFGFYRVPAGCALTRLQVQLNEPPVGGPATITLVKPDGTPWGITVTVLAGEAFGETVLAPAHGFVEGDELRGKTTVVGLTEPGGFGALTLFTQLT